MKIAAQDFLRLAEHSKTVACFDIEASGLRGDYNSVLVVSVKPYHAKPLSWVVRKPGDDKRVVKEATEVLSQYDSLVSYYGKGFDVAMLNTRALNWGLEPFRPKHHLDLYFTLKYHLLTAQKSQGHLLSWLRTPEQKMSVSAEDWNAVLRDPQSTLPIMRKRCESDVKGLEALYDKTKHLIVDVK